MDDILEEDTTGEPEEVEPEVEPDPKPVYETSATDQEIDDFLVELDDKGPPATPPQATSTETPVVEMDFDSLVDLFG